MKWQVISALLGAFLLEIQPTRSSRSLHVRHPPRHVQEAADSTDQQTDVRNYKLLTSGEIAKILEQFKTSYPDLVQVTTTQEKYGLPRAGEASDCSWDSTQAGCPNYMVTVQDFIAHPEGSESSNHLPEVFWSGCLHGDERVGPTATVEALSLLLEATACEALPRPLATDRPAEVKAATECRHILKTKGIDDAHRKWLARLVSTRRLVVVPTSNALGYDRNEREENNIDPNRDFPYDLTDATKCMQTIAGRSLNEIFREHMFQLALTFHAGMEVVGYEWGAPTWLHHFSPDDKAQEAIASAYSRFGGGWSTSKPYKYGTMNDLVYYVRGGMEDWAYAGSFDSSRVPQCKPTTFDGYDADKTVYNNSTLRVFNMLIETSDRKTPRNNELGSSLDVLHGDTNGNGHVSRNIRLALLSAEMVEPYVSITRVNDVDLSDDIVPLIERDSRSYCQTKKGVIVSGSADQVTLEWTVGGAMSVDNTEVWFARWSDIAQDDLDCMSPPKSLDAFTKGAPIGATNGTGVFSAQGSTPKSEASRHGMSALGPTFQATIDLNQFQKMEKIVVIAAAQVDQEWSSRASNVKPDIPPQSHLVNVRTNPDWNHHNAGKHIVGRLVWYSIPVTVVVGDYEDSVGKQGDHVLETVELFNRFGAPDGQHHGGVHPSPPSSTFSWRSGWGAFGLFLGIFGGISIAYCLVASRRASGYDRTTNPNDEFSDSGDNFVFDSKPYSDFDAENRTDEEVEFPTLA